MKPAKILAAPSIQNKGNTSTPRTHVYSLCPVLHLSRAWRSFAYAAHEPKGVRAAEDQMLRKEVQQPRSLKDISDQRRGG